MKLAKLCLIFFSISLFSNVYAVAEKYESRYTTLEAKHCVTLHEEQSAIVQECPGFGGFQLHVSEFDLRQSISVVRNEREYPLQFASTVSPSFSSLGTKAEWRFNKADGKLTPIALIARLNAVTGEEANQTTSWLVVSKLGKDQICVVGKIPPQRDGSQNQKARDMAERASGLSCVK